MAEESTALSVVETQQDIVGGAMVGAAGTGVLAEAPTDSTTQILEQIRDIQVKTLRGISDIGKTMREIFDLDKLQDRRAREDATENDKERLNPDGVGAGAGDDIDPQDADKKSGGMFAFLGGLPGAGLFKKMFAPIMAFFGKSGLLVKLFGKFGPLGALIIGFTLIYKYSDEIAAALAPALDKIKELIPKLKPVIDFLKMVGDFFIKTILENLGGLFENIIDSITSIVDGFQMLFDGDILGGLSKIFGGIFDFVLAFPKAILDTVVDLLTPLAAAVGDFFKQLYDDIVLYITDTITNIKNFFIDLATNIVTFFTDAYNTVKTTIVDAVQGAFNFIGDIFNGVKDFFKESYEKAKDFITGLPERILDFVKNMFSPIIDFFSGIGDRIKIAVNGIIDALPLPDFIKNKMKFDVEPTQTNLDDAEAQFADLETPEADGTTLKTKSTEKFNLKEGVLQNATNDGPMVFKKQGLAERNAEILSAATGDPYTAINTNKGFMVVNPENSLLPESLQPPEKIAATDTNTKMEDVEGTTGDTAPVIVTNNNYNTDNSSVASQTDVHSGKLDTGVDSYFDKIAFNARGYG